MMTVEAEYTTDRVVVEGRNFGTGDVVVPCDVDFEGPSAVADDGGDSTGRVSVAWHINVPGPPGSPTICVDTCGCGTGWIALVVASECSGDSASGSDGAAV